jgi:hypothetical protein
MNHKRVANKFFLLAVRLAAAALGRRLPGPSSRSLCGGATRTGLRIAATLSVCSMPGFRDNAEAAELPRGPAASLQAKVRTLAEPAGGALTQFVSRKVPRTLAQRLSRS